MQPHQSFDPMQPAGDAFSQQIVPHPPGAIGPIAVDEARAHLGAELFVASAAPTARLPEPGIEAAPRDTERPAHPFDRSDSSVLRDKGELHLLSFAKWAAAFFRMSRSALSLCTSRRSRSISACSGFISPCPGNASCGSASYALTQLRSRFG